jgi:hypothetical protein
MKSRIAKGALLSSALPRLTMSHGKMPGRQLRKSVANSITFRHGEAR